MGARAEQVDPPAVSGLPDLGQGGGEVGPASATVSQMPVMISIVQANSSGLALGCPASP